MLDELRIRGLGVIDDAVLPLGPGLTVVTGETGAGKTMVITGLLLLFGGRADPVRVRTGVAQASVDGRVLLDASSTAADRVRAAGGDLDDADGASPELILRRVVKASGRSRAYVGGTSAPVSVLSELADELLVVHGQSDQMRLARPDAQRGALDRYAGVDLESLGAAHSAWRAAVMELEQRTSRWAELRRESDLLAHGIAEIEQAAPQPGETVELERLAARLGHADALTLAARTAHDLLLGDAADPTADTPYVSGLLASAARSLTQHQDADTELGALASRLADISAATIDIGADLGAYADQLDADPGHLDSVETRRATLNVLIRRYCDEPEPTLDGVLRWANSARARLADIDVSDEAVAALRAAVETSAAALSAAALEVSRLRRSAAVELSALATTELAGLAMPDARLYVDVATRTPGQAPALTVDGEAAGVTAEGIDEVTLLLQPHPGSPALPIARGASGGELSRVMLALEVCLIGAAGSDSPSTLVFDEVDAGVGGRAAIEVGRRLARLARDRQVLVVTHLAQVAAFADRHIVVDKPVGDDQATQATQAAVTASDVRSVTGDDRLAELARMLSGSDTATAREHAAELLEQCLAPG